MKPKEIAISIAIVSISIVILAFLYISQQRRNIEKYEDELLVTCDRKLAFKAFKNSTLKASERAQETKVRLGVCPKTTTPSINTDASIIEENGIEYILQSACIVFSIKEAKEKEDTVTLTIPHSAENEKNLLYFFLTNPMYLEFEKSDPYKPDYETCSFYSNFHDSGDIKLQFKRLVPTGQPSEIFKDLTQVNITLYFIDTHPLLKYVPKYDENEIGQITFYTKRFFSIFEKMSPEYAFCDKLSSLLTNAANPVLTCHAEVAIPNIVATKRIEILKLYMETSTGKYTSCPNYVQLQTNKNNIITAYLEQSKPDDSYFHLKFITNNNADNAQKCSQAETLDIELPILQGHERFQVIFTVSPYSTIVICTWKVNNKEQFYIRRSPQCITDNQFKRIVSTSTNEDIKLAYTSQYVTDVKYFQLGQKSYIDDEAVRELLRINS